MDQTSKLHGAIVNLAKLDGLCISHLIGNGVAMESRSSLARINHETSFTMLPWFLVPNFVEELVAMGNAAEEQVCRSRTAGSSVVQNVFNVQVPNQLVHILKTH